MVACSLSSKVEQGEQKKRKKKSSQGNARESALFGKVLLQLKSIKLRLKGRSQKESSPPDVIE